MEPKENRLPTKDIIQRAVVECSKIESSLDGCLQVLHQGLPETTDTDIKPCGEIIRKLSYTICKGKKSSNLIEIDETSDLKEDSNANFMLISANTKLHHVLDSQRNMVQRLSEMRDTLVERNKQHEEVHKLIKRKWNHLINWDCQT